jgi:cytochrome c oxidase assembly factor CtaG
MIEHELVMAIAAPLLALARPLGILLWSMPQRLRRVLATTLASSNGRALWQGLTLPFIASSIHGLAIWIWHVPALFDATVSEVLLHRLQHLSFFTTGLLFWWAIFWRCDRGRGAWHLFVTMLHTGLLGAIITLAPEVVYDDQTRFASEWELTPLEDQQLAGLIMWVPGGLIYAGVALWFLTQWIKSAGKGGMDAHDFRAA